MVHIVGAGPGSPDLITVRGQRLLGEADVVIYAGSLVNPELLALAGKGAAVYDSARMTLEEVMDVVEQSHRAGLNVVRLHTGDPCLYGAIREQMDWMDRKGIPYDICPGVSSLDGVYPSGCDPERGNHQDGRQDAGAGKGIHTQLCSPWGFHGDIPEHGYAGGTVTGIDGRRIQGGYARCHCLQSHVARGRGGALYRGYA